MPNFKFGVDQSNMDYHLTSKYSDIDKVHQDIVGRDAMITSARDGRHMISSLHFSGKAIDLRTRDMGGKEKKVVEALKKKLGTSFDIVLESDHIHLEYDP
ncbi:MAG: hypothetical protein V3V22_09900 [Methylococcales bacterium]